MPRKRSVSLKTHFLPLKDAGGEGLIQPIRGRNRVNKQFISLLVCSKAIRLFIFSSRRYFTYYVASKVGLTVSSELEPRKKGRVNWHLLNFFLFTFIIAQCEGGCVAASNKIFSVDSFTIISAFKFRVQHNPIV